MSLWRRLVLATAALIIATAAVVGVLSFFSLRAVVVPRVLEQMELHLRVASYPLPTIVEAAANDLLIVGSGSSIKGIIRASRNDGVDPAGNVPIETWRERLASIFAVELAVDPRYLQFRLISASEDGREIVRVERDPDGKGIRTIPEDALQPKGDRPYLQRTLTGSKGAIFVSAIELNEERGVIEDPPKPVIRVSTPVVAPDGETFGILIINVDLRVIFAGMQAEMDPQRALYVMNENGEYLLSPDPARNFAFQRGGSARLGQDYPALAEAIAERRRVDQVVEDSRGQSYGVVLQPLRLAGDAQIFLAEIVPYSVLIAFAESAQRAIAIGALIAACCAILLATWLAGSLVRPINAMTAAAQAMERGERPVFPTASGELGTLSRAFASMAAEVEDKRTSLSQTLETQKRINAELHEKTARERILSLAVETSGDAIFIHDLDGRIQTWNEAAADLFGYAPDEIFGRTTEIIIPPDRSAEFMELLSAMGRGERIRHFETVRLTKDGRRVDVSLNISPVRDADGKLIGATKIARDISERKKSEAERAAWTEDLKRSNAELEQFAYIAAHDLQEPLRMVASYTELLAQRYKGQLDERADKYIGFAVDGAKRMKLLINDLLAFSRVGSQAKPFAPIDTTRLVHAVTNSLRHAIESSHAEIVVGDLPPIVGDEVQMGQLFQNLISNAIKFHSDKPPRIAIKARKPGANWVFSVEDNGIGIEPQYTDRIFQMFQRLNDRGSYEGNGIGLAIARKIVERHGGTIWFESPPGIGATFFFSIPEPPIPGKRN